MIKGILDHLLPDQYISLCPEVAGDLPTPRPPAEIQYASGIDVLQHQAFVLDNLGNDVSNAFIDGAHQTLKLAQQFKVTHAILKAKSPSCGSDLIYDGSFSGHKVHGDGITAALFKQHGITVMTEHEFLVQLSKTIL